MAERAGYGVKRDYRVLNWEQNDFPILCDDCLGESSHLRILKKPLGAECKLCSRPYTTFHWKPKGNKARIRRTEVCSTCSKINNSCQACVQDLELNLPIDIRNKLMGENKVELLVSEGNRDIFTSLYEANSGNKPLPYSEGLKAIKAETSGIDNKNLKNEKITVLKGEQKEIIENYQKAKQITEGMGNKSITLKYITAKNKEDAKNKIDLYFKDQYEEVYDKGVLNLTFQETDIAEKFMKIFSSNFILKGIKISVDWKREKDEEEETVSPPKIEPPSVVKIKNEEGTDQKALLLMNLDKELDNN